MKAPITLASAKRTVFNPATHKFVYVDYPPRLRGAIQNWGKLIPLLKKDKWLQLDCETLSSIIGIKTRNFGTLRRISYQQSPAFKTKTRGQIFFIKLFADDERDRTMPG